MALGRAVPCRAESHRAVRGTQGSQVVGRGTTAVRPRRPHCNVRGEGGREGEGAFQGGAGWGGALRGDQLLLCLNINNDLFLFF